MPSDLLDALSERADRAGVPRTLIVEAGVKLALESFSDADLQALDKLADREAPGRKRGRTTRKEDMVLGALEGLKRAKESDIARAAGLSHLETGRLLRALKLRGLAHYWGEMSFDAKLLREHVWSLDRESGLEPHVHKYAYADGTHYAPPEGDTHNPDGTATDFATVLYRADMRGDDVHVVRT